MVLIWSAVLNDNLACSSNGAEACRQSNSPLVYVLELYQSLGAFSYLSGNLSLQKMGGMDNYPRLAFDNDESLNLKHGGPLATVKSA